jgi:gliding motility-associated protein GldC
VQPAPNELNLRRTTCTCVWRDQQIVYLCRMANTSEIKVNITLDEKRVPEHIQWTASDAHQDHPAESKSVLMAFLDKETLDTSTLFLWTKECQVTEMDRKIYYVLTAIADGYFNATQHAELANEMRRFVQYFGEKTGILNANGENN